MASVTSSLECHAESLLSTQRFPFLRLCAKLIMAYADQMKLLPWPWPPIQIALMACPPELPRVLTMSRNPIGIALTQSSSCNVQIICLQQEAGRRSAGAYRCWTLEDLALITINLFQNLREIQTLDAYFQIDSWSNIPLDFQPPHRDFCISCELIIEQNNGEVSGPKGIILVNHTACTCSIHSASASW